MSARPSSKFMLIMVAVALVGGGALDYFAFNQLSANQQSLADVQKKQSDSRNVPIQLQQAKGKLADMQARLVHLEEGLPSASYLPTMLKELEAMGNGCNVKVIGVRPQPATVAPITPAGSTPPPLKPYDTVDIEVKGRGKYKDGLAFIHALKTFPKIVEARSVTLEPESNGNRKQASGPPVLTLTIELRCYMFKEATPTKGDVQHA